MERSHRHERKRTDTDSVQFVARFGKRFGIVSRWNTYTYNRWITRWIAFPSLCVVLVDAEFAACFDVAKRAARRVRRKRCALLRDRRHHTQQEWTRSCRGHVVAFPPCRYRPCPVVWQTQRNRRQLVPE